LKKNEATKTQQKMRVGKTGLVIAALMVTAVVSAQEKGDRKTAEERAKMKTERIAEELSLTEDQKSKVLALNLEAAKKHDAIKSNASLTEEQKKEQLQNSRKEMKAKVDALLTDEQRAKAEEKRDEMHRGGMHHGEKGTPEERAQRHTERMTEMLSLSEGQISQVQAINLEAVNKADELHASTTLSDDEKHAAMKAHHEATKEKIEAVLTEEQRAQLKEQHEAMKAEMKAHHDKWANATPEQRAQLKTERMSEELSLTDEQKKKVTDLHLRIDKKMEAIRSNAALSDEQQKAEMKTIHAEKRKELKTILTEEQLKLMKERKHPHDDE
jgi:periplasmic protein CpxP/Spy